MKASIKDLLVSYANLAEKASLQSRVLLLEAVVMHLICILATVSISPYPGTKTALEALL